LGGAFAGLRRRAFPGCLRRPALRWSFLPAVFTGLCRAGRRILGQFCRPFPIAVFRLSLSALVVFPAQFGLRLFVAANLLGQAAGPPPEFALLLRQRLGLTSAAGGAGLQVLLPIDDLVELLQVLADSRLLRLDPLRAILGQQEFEQFMQIGVDTLLAFDRRRELVLGQKVDERL
jgi:hypothetical protein